MMKKMYKTKKLWTTSLSTILLAKPKTQTLILPSLPSISGLKHHYLSTSPQPQFSFSASNLRNHLFNSFHSQSSHEKCWNCGAVAETPPFLFCHSCRCVQPLDHSLDYFQIFGLEKKYEIEDDANLEGMYKQWQKKLHPDLVHSKSQKERAYAAEQSERVIDAYHTLKDPLSRAIYIMKLEGVHVDQEETISEPELLAEIMEIRESVEEAPDSNSLNQIRSQIEEKLKHWSNSFANAFRSQKFEESIDAIRRMTYYDRVIEEIVKRL
ncbi:DnaJ domain-containing protein/HSCB_C domain-containing protein [Cephalotus follicularis]|uniref:DnaJ domain-containing protein/HSCB_C domain-containing protein n=1 Tax=Cephalotus follicularis TaxID=3775 RepID=A0A1Q3B779_CEPFO|nr:DnaJ domain-containing protein/HSCB_C domain-containing protein [Cephalotus follicularis]